MTPEDGHGPSALSTAALTLVHVEWQDSSQPLPSWRHLTDLPERSVIRCLSVGWLVHSDEEALMLAPNLGDRDDPENAQACGFIVIPRSAVVCITNLAEPLPTARRLE